MAASQQFQVGTLLLVYDEYEGPFVGIVIKEFKSKGGERYFDVFWHDSVTGCDLNGSGYRANVFDAIDSQWKVLVC